MESAAMIVDFRRQKADGQFQDRAGGGSWLMLTTFDRELAECQRHLDDEDAALAGHVPNRKGAIVGLDRVSGCGGGPEPNMAGRPSELECVLQQVGDRRGEKVSVDVHEVRIDTFRSELKTAMRRLDGGVDLHLHDEIRHP